jgi:hypothetical protein
VTTADGRGRHDANRFNRLVRVLPLYGRPGGRDVCFRCLRQAVYLLRPDPGSNGR